MSYIATEVISGQPGAFMITHVLTDYSSSLSVNYLAFTARSMSNLPVAVSCTEYILVFFNSLFLALFSLYIQNPSHDNPKSNQWQLSGVDIVNIIPVPFHARQASVEQAVPNASLFPVIVTRLPTLAVVKVMVLQHQLHIK